MSDFNTFTGKTVDEAIGEACRFFATERDKLEVEIISGGSTGIFGLVGKKKAQIRARRRQDPAVAALIREEERRAEAEKARATQPGQPRAGQPGAEPQAAREAGQARGGNGSAIAAGPGAADDAAFDEADEPAVSAEEAGEPGNGQQRRQGNRRGRGRRGRDQGSSDGEARQARQGNGDGNGRSERRDGSGGGRNGQEPAGAERPRAEKPRPAPRPRREDSEDEVPETHDTTPASPELIALASEIMSRLLTPILEQEPVMEIEGTAGRVSVLIRDEEHSGLLIGREGQTLAALQYLANRIMARRWETPVRVQVNTGEYREKQDDNLRKMAAFLADKARNLGRPQSTKPLSSYHRRVIHLALQGDETIQTRSKGDGPMKRVIIVPRRQKPVEQQPAQ